MNKLTRSKHMSCTASQTWIKQAQCHPQESILHIYIFTYKTEYNLAHIISKCLSSATATKHSKQNMHVSWYCLSRNKTRHPQLHQKKGTLQTLYLPRSDVHWRLGVCQMSKKIRASDRPAKRQLSPKMQKSLKSQNYISWRAQTMKSDARHCGSCAGSA